MANCLCPRAWRCLLATVDKTSAQQKKKGNICQRQRVGGESVGWGFSALPKPVWWGNSFATKHSATEKEAFWMSTTAVTSSVFRLCSIQQRRLCFEWQPVPESLTAYNDFLCLFNTETGLCVSDRDQSCHNPGQARRESHWKSFETLWLKHSEWSDY